MSTAVSLKRLVFHVFQLSASYKCWWPICNGGTTGYSWPCVSCEAASGLSAKTYNGYRAAAPKHMDWILNNMPYYRNWYGSAALIKGMRLPPFSVDDPEWRPKGGLINARNDGMRKGLTEYIRGSQKRAPIYMVSSYNSTCHTLKSSINQPPTNALMKQSADCVLKNQTRQI